MRTAPLLGCFAPGFFRLTRPFARFVLALTLA
jgi:hypothetical protein